MLSLKPTFSLSTFTFKRLLNSSSLSAIRVVSSACLRLLIFLLAILIPPSRAPAPCPPAAIQSIHCYFHRSQETDEECDTRWVTYFKTSDVDAQELRKGKNILAGYDLVPEPKITVAGFTVHIIEVIKSKAGPHKEIYPCVIQELRPTLNELGISSPEELGLHKV
uniref:Cytochrome c oxidase subunit 5A, mitochondrial n=1 Tax=Bos taurus TaxID=9913 RepID=A0A3Q1M132_BOVIN